METAGVAIDFAILQEHRGFGPALKHQRMVTKDLKDRGINFIYAYPNKQAEPVFKRVRYKTVLLVLLNGSYHLIQIQLQT